MALFLLFQRVCVFSERVITGLTATAPAFLGPAGTALQGDSATGRPQSVGPTCSSVTSMPPVNTAMGQQGRPRAGVPPCYLQTDPTHS